MFSKISSVNGFVWGSSSKGSCLLQRITGTTFCYYISDNPSENEGLINNENNNNNNPCDYSHQEKNRDSRKGSSLSRGSSEKNRSSERQLHQSSISRFAIFHLCWVFSLVVFVYVPVLAKFKAVQWDDSLPTMVLCTVTASPFFFQFEEIFKCYESKLSTATILFSILAVGIFLGSL